jgi:hypothetical protein
LEGYWKGAGHPRSDKRQAGQSQLTRARLKAELLAANARLEHNVEEGERHVRDYELAANRLEARHAWEAHQLLEACRQQNAALESQHTEQEASAALLAEERATLQREIALTREVAAKALAEKELDLTAAHDRLALEREEREKLLRDRDRDNVNANEASLLMQLAVVEARSFADEADRATAEATS